MKFFLDFQERTPLPLDFLFSMDLIHEADSITQETAGLAGDSAA